MTPVSGSSTESYQERFNRRLYEPGAFVWAHRHLPERARMWSPWWLRHVVAVERTLHDRTAESLRLAWEQNP